MKTEELKAKIETIQTALEEKQPLLAKALGELEEASEDEVKTALEEQIDALSNEIDALRATAQKAYDNYTRLTPSNFLFENGKGETAGGVDINKLEQMLNNLHVERQNDVPEGKAKKSVGEYVADYLTVQGVRNEDSWDRVFGKNFTEFSFNLDDSDRLAKDTVKSLTSVKSLYTNGGTELVDGGTPVPGFQGYGCTIFEVADECEICIRPTTFGDFLTVRNMPNGNTIQYDFPVSRTDNAGGVLETIYNPYPTKAQNGRKPEGTFTYNTAKVRVSKIAEFVTASDEVLDDCAKVANRIDRFLTSSLIRERDRQLIAGTGTAGQILGLLNQPGTLALDADDLITGIDVPNVWDKLYMAMLELENNCARIDGVIINPADRSKVALAKDANGNYLFPQEGNCDVTRVGCLELRTSVDVPEGTVIMGEFRNNWVWYVRKNLVLKVGMTGDQFIENTRTFLAELRGAAILFCPEKVAIVTNI